MKPQEQPSKDPRILRAAQIRLLSVNKTYKQALLDVGFTLDEIGKGKTRIQQVRRMCEKLQKSEQAKIALTSFPNPLCLLL